jgi:SAM-dependent methyltransferase
VSVTTADPSAAEWATADPYAAALRTGRGPLFLRRADGWLLPLEVERWCADADRADREALDRCEGAVLDVGCGPGRLVAELAARGRTVLGIDVSEAAVARTVRLGGPALRRSVFDRLPGEGRWGTLLLMDGNIGIGGDPRALLDRAARLLRPGGLLIAETDPADIDERAEVRVVGLTDARRTAGRAFPWARLGTPALLSHARAAGWSPVGQWACGDRRFAQPQRQQQRRTGEEDGRDQQPAGQEAVRRHPRHRPVAVLHPPCDQREPHEQQHPRQSRGHPHIHRPLPPPHRAETSYDGPVHERVQRQQHQVVQQRGPHEPQRHTEPVALQQPDPRITGQCERAAQQEELERAAERKGTRAHHRSPNVSRATHLVFSTPGAAGTMIRAGWP